MPHYRVRYVTASGAIEHVEVEAPREQALAARLAVRPADIIHVTEQTSRGLPLTTHRPRGDARSFPLRGFCQELSVLLDSGIALYEGLQALQEKEASAANRQVLSDLAEQLAQGHTLAQAMAARRDLFGGLLVASIEAGQHAGLTSRALRQHAAYLAWLGSLRDRLVGAMIYPAILVVASVLVMGFLTAFVIPRFADIYADLGGDLPWMTRALLAFGQAVDTHPQGVALVAALIVAAALAGWRSPAFRRPLTAGVWRLPQVGARARLMELAALYRTLGLLLQAGVPMVAALHTSSEMVGAGLRPRVAAVAHQIEEGMRLSDTLENQELATSVALRMLRVGEHTGQLGAMLERAATFHDEELARFSQWMGKVVNPLLMLVMGALIGGIVILMYLPIFQVAEQIQ